MNEAAPDPRFYVVGGTVQPGRGCYVSRAADGELFRRISDGDYCHVLAQRQVGKSSLAAATAAKLRSRSVGVALVDLTQASAEDPAENTGRWYYSIAYRVCRDLRIRADLQSWWAERGGLTNLQRLREFFQEIVLQETEEPVAIFFDRVEATLDAPLAQDLFACIRACYDARATNPEFARLTFTLLSSAAPAELVSSVQGSPFEISTTVRLPDFSPQEMAALMAGLGPPPDDAEAVLARVWSWTRGHPYLSQKVFRGLARRKGDSVTVAAVDELVRTQFLAPKTLQEEPHLTVIAAQLLRENSSRTARLNLYGRIRKGVEVTADAASAIEQELTVAGLIYASPAGELRVRNEIYAMVFSTRWVNQHLPYGVRGIAAAAAILVAVIALPVWYTEYLPRPYVRALSTANQDFQVAEDAYTNLARLPGYGGTADRLLESFLVRNSRQAERYAEVQRINERLLVLPDGVRLGETLRAEYWERISTAKMHAGDRDGALVAALEALQVPSTERRQRVAELTGRDYDQLIGTFYTAANVRALEADAQTGQLTVLDAQNSATVWRLSADAPVLVRTTSVRAEEQLQLELRRYFDSGLQRPRLLIALQHDAPEQIEIGLRAPSGQEARIALSQGRAVGNFSYAFDFARFPDLKKLASAESQGNWTLLVTDREVGVSGELLAWDIVVGSETTLRDSASALQPIPEPRPTSNANVRLGADGRLALAWPQSGVTPGPVQIWDVGSGTVVSQVPRDDSFRDAAFALQGRRVLTLEESGVRVWDTASGNEVGVLSAAADGLETVTLVLSANGRFVALTDRSKADEPAIVVWDVLDMRRVGRIVAAIDMATFTVDSTGTRLAQSGRDAWVRVWSLADSSLTHELLQSAPARSLRFDATGEWLATDDVSNTFRLWSMADVTRPLVERAGNAPWKYRFAANSQALIYGSYDRAYQVLYLPEGLAGAVPLRHSALSSSSALDYGVAPVLLPLRSLAVTTDARQGVKVWQLPAATSGRRRAESVESGVRTALSADGQRIAAGTTSDDIRLYAAGAPGVIPLVRSESEESKEQPAHIVRLRFSADRDTLAASTTDGRVYVWDTASGLQRIAPFEHLDGPVLDLRVISAGRFLVSASGLEVQVTDLNTGLNVARLRIQASTPDLAFAAETGDIYVADDRGGVTRWNWQSGAAESAVPGEYQVRKVAVSADGARLVTAGADLVLRHWNNGVPEPLPETISAAGELDELWLAAGGRQLVAQAGHWLHTASVVPAGLAHRHTRFLTTVPVAAQPTRSAAGVWLLSSAPAAARPSLQKIAVAKPAAEPVDGDPAELLAYWRSRLALQIAADGAVTRTPIPTTAAP